MQSIERCADRITSTRERCGADHVPRPMRIPARPLDFFIPPIPVTLPTLPEMSWQPKRDAKVAARDALIPADLRIPRDHALWNARKATASDIAVLERSGLLSADELRITAMSTVELAAEIRQGRLSAVQACKVRPHVSRTILLLFAPTSVSRLLFYFIFIASAGIRQAGGICAPIVEPAHGNPL